MVGSMLAFAFEDLFLKRAASVIPPGQVIAMMGAAGAACFWLVALRRGEPILCRAALSPAALIRALSEAVATMLYVTALALIPLSVNSALLQASPLVVTMGAALFLGEPVGWRRWSAILVGFAGVIVILRPFGAGFEAAGLLTVACVVVLAARDLATRVMPASIGTFQLTTWAYLAMVPAGIILMGIAGTAPQTMEPARLLDLTFALMTGLVGYWAVTAAMRLGEVSVVAPFRYTRLVFAMILAMLFLGERPDFLTYAGSALVIGSGLYTFWRETRRKSLSKRGRAG
ncbi:DMT family transporter [Tabrizicola sp. DMG-N-6]|uniref:DMT family transporter n=2 Tax=Szabonella alba TaxID=2804194 RepID=A0A8K0Y198_9RHOB|nr:DMT family transporter [Szabonella alba]MBL4917657.1 DMT family transporter [Szabonella alba]